MPQTISAIGASITERHQGCEPPFQFNRSGMGSKGPQVAMPVLANLTNPGVDSKLAHKDLAQQGEKQWRTSW